jgi:hypothetical protein
MLDGFVPPLIVLLTAGALMAFRKFYFNIKGPRIGQTDVAVMAVIVFTTALLEREMGRPYTYRHGPVRVWSGDIHSNQNSQQIADPYTFTHVIHGAAFYGLTALALPGASIGARAIVAIALESAWEAYENTDTVIQRYRAVTISLGYYGDSQLNSVCDIAACAIGFLLAWRLPRRVTIAWVVAVELILALWIRDNLTLNVIMLVWPIKAIARWQAGLP